MAKSFQTEFSFPGRLYVDQQRTVYQALGCNRGLKFVLSGKALKAIKTANSEGFEQGKTQGDALQLGGVFVISKTNGIVFQHLEQFAGDHADLAEVLTACKQMM